MGTCGGGRVPAPNTPCPVQCLMMGALGACVGQWGCTGAGMGHGWEPQHNDEEVEAGTGYEGGI